jgi:aminoglycoside phosphotransferase (APT) family kinase protein
VPNVIDKLIELHQVDYHAAGMETLGKGAGYCRRQVEGWSERYLKAKTWNVPSFRYGCATGCAPARPTTAPPA